MLGGDDSWHVRFATWAVAQMLADLFIILLLFSSCLSLDSRSETELHLWSLQRHTQLGGSVSCTSAGLQAPKQVSPALVRSSALNSPRLHIYAKSCFILPLDQKCWWFKMELTSGNETRVKCSVPPPKSELSKRSLVGGVSWWSPHDTRWE